MVYLIQVPVKKLTGFFMQKKQATKSIAPVLSLKKIRNYENRCTNLQFFILKQTQ